MIKDYKQDIIVLAGSPGSGKDTQAKLLVEYFKSRNIDIVWINSSDVLKDRIVNFKNRVGGGELIPDSEVIQVLLKALKDSLASGAKIIILTGYPRTVAQSRFLVEELNSFNLRIALGLELIVDEDELIRRLSLRAQVEGRSDDDKLIIKKRLDIYNETTKMALNELSKNGVLVKQVDGVGDQNTILKRIAKEMEIIDGS